MYYSSIRIILRHAGFAIFIAMAVLSTPAQAYFAGTQTVTLDGRLFSSQTSDTPLLDPSVAIDIKIYNQAATCILYEEKQTTDTTANDGRFTILVGSTVGASKRVSGEPGNTMLAIFQNNAAMASSCGAYTPVGGESRIMRITVTPSTSGVAEQLSPDVTVDSVPNAMVAESLQGLDRDHVLAIDNSTSLSQTNIANVFSSSNYSSLTSLIGGTSTSYVGSSAGGAVIPNVSTVPSSPAVGQIWYNSSANAYQYWNGTAVQQIGFSGTGGSTSSSTSQWANVTGGINYGSGNVGIGSSSPAFPLDVVGNVNASSFSIGGSTAILLPGFASVSVGTYASNGNPQTAVGAEALAFATGYDNVAVGPYSSRNMTSGSQNTSVGRTALYANQTGSDNTAIGYYALYVAKGTGNTALGAGAGSALDATGDANTFLGTNAGNNISSGSANIAIGYNAAPASNSGSNQLSIGNVIYGDLTNSLIGIGTSAPQAALDVWGTGTGASALIVPRDTSANRPAGVNGMIRYNTSVGSLETYSSGAWVGLTTGAAAGVNGSGTSGYLAKFSGASSVTNSSLMDDGNHVGIGTAPTSTRLTVNGDTQTTRFLSTDNEGSTYPGYAFSVGGDGNGMGMFYITTNTFGFSTNSLERMRIDPSGNVGIGTNAPAATLDVKGHIANSAPGTPTLSSCGSATITGNDTRGLVTGTPPDGCVITFATAYASSPYCTLTRYGGTGTSTVIAVLALSTTSFTVGASGTYAGFIYMCMQ